MTATDPAEDDAIASLESVKRLVGTALLAAHMGLRDHAERILAGAAAARPNARYLPVARAYIDMISGDPEGAMRSLAELSNGNDELAADALRVIVLAATTGGYNDRARSAAERLQALDPEGTLSFIQGLPVPLSQTTL